MTKNQKSLFTSCGLAAQALSGMDYLLFFKLNMLLIHIDNSLSELYNYIMEIVADASALLAVLLNESDRDWVIDKTVGQSIIAPEILHYELGNALISLLKKGSLSEREILRAFELSQRVAVTLVPVEIREAIKIAVRFKIYAYDAYYLQCCLENKAGIISLDSRMCEIAGSLGIKVAE